MKAGLGKKNRKPTWSKAADALLVCLFCLLLFFGFSNRGDISRYSTVSLRYDSPISGSSAYSARLYSISRSGGGVFWPTFWREHKSAFVSEFSSADADCIAFSGDASLVWPFEYISGCEPGVRDGAGCVLSEPLARRLWGSTDIVGMTVDVDGEARIIRGVFKSKAELALISFGDEVTDRSWTAAELSGGPENASRSDAESYAISCGLGKPDAVIVAGGQRFLAGALAILPLLIPVGYGLALISGLAKRRYPGSYRNIRFVCIIALGCMVPVLINALPAWLVPTRWSDFSFWSASIDRIADDLTELLNASPRLRDAELKSLLIKQASIAFLSVCASISYCFRWRLRIEPPQSEHAPQSLEPERNSATL